MDGKGIFISFEGIDGAGKSTHMAALADAFEQQGRVVVQTREPGGSPLAEKLRALVLADAMDALTEALLVFAARRDHIRTCIAPALARGEVVLSDRFTDSSFAYQGGGQGLATDVLAQLESWVQSIPGGSAGGALLQPDLSLWFELAPELAAARLADARAPDRFESRDTAFFERVHAAYAQRRQAEARRFARIDAALPREHVWQAVLSAVRERGWLA